MSAIGGYDLIGDIHGYADELENLLVKMGYASHHGVYCHPERKVVFLGDFIDRGPKIKQVLDIARGMVESGNAVAVMGNHEFNALAYHTSRSEREHDYLRPRTEKNIQQHSATLQQLCDRELAEALDWFRTLPMWAEIQGPNGTKCRAVHACWDVDQISCIADAKANDSKFSNTFLVNAMVNESLCSKRSKSYSRGKSWRYLQAKKFRDKEGHERSAIRTKWFLEPTSEMTYAQYALQADPIECSIKIERAWLKITRATQLLSHLFSSGIIGCEQIGRSDVLRMLPASTIALPKTVFSVDTGGMVSKRSTTANSFGSFRVSLC